MTQCGGERRDVSGATSRSRGAEGPAGCAGAASVAAGKRRRAPIDCGNLPFLIRRDGTWLYRGSPIGRKELVCLFASVLKREEDGSYWLETPAERGRIEVEDVPFVAVELDWTGSGRGQRLSFRTNIDEVVTADAEHPIRVAHDLLTCHPTPYLMVRPGGGGEPGIEARIGRAVYYELAALAEPGWIGCRRALGVWSCRKFFPLGELPAGEDAGAACGRARGIKDPGHRDPGHRDPGHRDPGHRDLGRED